MSTEMMTCRELVELVTDYLEGSMGPEDRVRFERHIAICPACRGYLSQMRHILKVSGRLSEESISEKARDDLLEAFRQWKRR